MSGKVSIVVLNWNGLADTIECLESLKKITYPSYEVVVVDNASKGEDVRVLREKYGDYIHVIQNDQNYGFAKGNNVGIRYALQQGAAYVLLLNNDTTVAPDFLIELIRVAEAEPDIGLLSPLIYRYFQPDVMCGGQPIKVHLWIGQCWETGKPKLDQPWYESDLVLGTALLIPRRTIESVGILGDEYFLGCEDMDYSLRAKRAGFRLVFVTRAKVWHKVSQSSRNVDTVYYQHQGWMTLRRKFLPRYYALATVFALAFSVMETVYQVFNHTLHGEFRWLGVLPNKIAAAFRGMLKGKKVEGT